MVKTEQRFEVHDVSVLNWARELIDRSPSHQTTAHEVVHSVHKNEIWRGRECLNLLAPEAPSSPIVRKLLSSEVGIRAAEGHIGPKQRWFAGTQYIDEIEALCMELLKKAFGVNYADHRLIASMLGNMTVYATMTNPGDPIMSMSQPVGGHSSNRKDGPSGIRGLEISDVPMDPVELTVDLDAFERVAREIQPKLVSLGASMTLFPFPLKEIRDIISEWGGQIFFDGAHQLGLIAGGQFQDPLNEGASIMTGSAGKTFSGPQSGIILWNDPNLTEPITDTIFPALAATHQVNRVAALAVAAAEFIAFGKEYMGQVVANAKALGKALQKRGITVLGSHKGFTQTHQVIIDVKEFGGGYPMANLLAEANIITNKNLIPSNRPEDWDEPSGIRIGTTEITRLGMKEEEMDYIADLIANVLQNQEKPENVKNKVMELRNSFQQLHYCFQE
ncbi:serine hydroxymethyltransferase [Salinibacillus xinjiangensis]|uniref:Aminotransferase class I/II-fold pyridoxal phosphate-dependent enzyme n=1 Tax=Salinibacillus xinjiangensis TaxID=1229268 RepID=A0A6G1X4A4_9BACI|nr:serine hydroxymethyltransferase [Salinibacillus xinjiangensis]MRG85777.1 aminotransferase class I/II-fold pyridoxal phosphate-dependent enzyme [Salinibacillus xinjiangensis]